MPIYQYHCNDCNRQEDYLVGMSDSPNGCSDCGSKDITRVLAGQTVSGHSGQKRDCVSMETIVDIDQKEIYRLKVTREVRRDIPGTNIAIVAEEGVRVDTGEKKRIKLIHIK